MSCPPVISNNVADYIVNPDFSRYLATIHCHKNATIFWNLHKWVESCCQTCVFIDNTISWLNFLTSVAQVGKVGKRTPTLFSSSGLAIETRKRKSQRNSGQRTMEIKVWFVPKNYQSDEHVFVVVSAKITACLLPWLSAVDFSADITVVSPVSGKMIVSIG